MKRSVGPHVVTQNHGTNLRSCVDAILKVSEELLCGRELNRYWRGMAEEPSPLNAKRDSLVPALSSTRNPAPALSYHLKLCGSSCHPRVNFRLLLPSYALRIFARQGQ